MPARKGSAAPISGNVKQAPCLPFSDKPGALVCMLQKQKHVIKGPGSAGLLQDKGVCRDWRYVQA